MSDMLFEILKAVVVLAVVLLVRYAVPYFRLLLENTKYAWVAKWVERSVKSAEQTVLGDKRGEERNAIVTEFIKELLQKKNIALSDKQIDTLIESVVYEMNREKVSGESLMQGELVE